MSNENEGAGRRQPTGPRAPRLGGTTTDATVHRLLGYPEAAAFLGTTERHVRGLWQQRRIAAVKVGRLVRFDPADLAAYRDRHRVEALR